MSPRTRDLGIRIGRGTPGDLNAITDVPGVRVGHQSVIRGPDGDPGTARTGVTAIFPHSGTPWDEPVYVGTHILNGYGELIGINQLREWGVLMSPIVLTSSLAIGKAYDATVRWIAGTSEEWAQEVMPIVSECDDSFLNAVLTFPLTDDDVAAALGTAVGGPVAEGSVGSGVGMQCFDFKGGIGTASRAIPADEGGFTVGVLVMTNHGDRAHLLIDGVRVGEAIADFMPTEHSEGSCVVVVATDAPLLPHQLDRVAQRAGLGLARGGSMASNGSGEQMIAFSTANRLPRAPRDIADVRAVLDGPDRPPWLLSALFAATVEATEEAVANALFAATTVIGHDGNTLFAMPHEPTLAALDAAGRLSR
ncbi:MAG: D-aminopeptidase [Actinomycetota bacterium]|jgi:D-aminopeptidase|nr:D-aminopeptidase [Actinomycetota bacterium]